MRPLPGSLTLLLAAATALGSTAAQTPGRTTAAAADTDPARAFFAKGEVLRLRLQLEPVERQKLRDRPREYVPATLSVDSTAPWTGLGVKLKGAAGSFRQVDERPGFTVHLGKFGGEQRLHGLRRFHLNNGLQDDSRLSEWLGGEIFRAAGYPAPRVAHARVWLDGEDLGIYVLREGFDAQFLQRVFGNTNGNLYDGGFCEDIDAALEKDAGSGPDDRSDLRRLLDGCRAAAEQRETTLEAVLDLAAFVDFAALEAMLGHWDGYTQNRNNFRLWLPVEGQARFLPHGMDQLFGDADASILGHPPTIVGNAVLGQAIWRKRYRDRMRELLPLFAPGRWEPRLRALGGRLVHELRDRPDQAKELDRAVQDLLDRLTARYRSLQSQVKAPEPKPLVFPSDRPIALKTWHPAAESDGIALHRKDFKGVAALQITCTSRGDEPRRGAWRAHALLAKGRYVLLATARCEGVLRPVGDAGEAVGGLRLAVGDARSERLGGDENWRQLRCEFTVAEFQRDVEFELGLGAHAGTAWFRLDSLKLQRLPD